MPTRGKDWNDKIKFRAVVLWRRKRDWSRERIAAEVDAWADAHHIDKQGRTVTERNVRDWTPFPRDGQPWDVTQAPLEELRHVARLYRHARQEDGPEAWPTVGQARWWARLCELVPGMSVGEVYETGLYADTRPLNEQQQIGVQLLEYVARERELLARRRTGAQPGPDEPAIGGTAIADKMDLASASSYQYDPTAAAGSPTPFVLTTLRTT